MTGLAHEHMALMACVRRGLGLDAPRQATTCLDWDAFLHEVVQHALAPLVYAGLEALDQPPPARVLAGLRASRALAALRHQAGLQPALRETLGALHREGLDPIVLKGAALSYQVYPTPGLRTMTDLDLLLPPHQLGQADATLRALGFQPSTGPLPREHHHLAPLITPDGLCVVELHHDVLPDGNPYAIEIGALHARARACRLGGIEARVLAPEHALLLTCVHMAWSHRYQWFPLRALVDILAITTSAAPPVDWDRFVAVVHRTRTAGAVYWPLYLSAAWLQARVPTFVLVQLAPPRALRRLQEVVLQSPYALNGKAPPGGGSAVLYSMLRELSLYGGCPPRAQARAVLRSLFPPPHAIAHLPPEVMASRVLYLLHLWHPPRLLRGLLAWCALLTRLRRSPSAANGPPRGACLPVGTRTECQADAWSVDRALTP